MLVLKILFILLFFFVSLPQASAESIAQAASRITKARAEKAELEKNRVKTGEAVKDIGNLSIEDFLELEAVPDGMDAVSAQALNGASDAFGFMTTEQALDSVAAMREQGIELPEDLEKNIKQNPEKASSLMNEAFQKIKPTSVQSKEDIAKQRKQAIQEAENNSGIKFKDVLEQQRRMMTAPPEKDKKTKKRGQKIQ